MDGGGVGEETLQLLTEQVAKFGLQDPPLLCGDFSARSGKLKMNSEGIPSR